MIIYIARHQLTEWNKERIVQGWTDSKLTPEGEERSHDLGKKLQNRGIEKIYSSDLGRCVQTTEIINSYLKIPVEYTPALREQHCGDMEGKSKVELRERIIHYDSHPDEAPPGGESLNDVRRRALAFINMIKENRVLIVTHGGTTSTILAECYGLPPDSKECNLPQPTLITIEKNGMLRVVNTE